MTERLTMTGPNTLMHELTYDDPRPSPPLTTRMEWTRDDSYQFYEYAATRATRPCAATSPPTAPSAAVARGDKAAETLAGLRTASPRPSTGPRLPCPAPGRGRL